MYCTTKWERKRCIDSNEIENQTYDLKIWLDWKFALIECTQTYWILRVSKRTWSKWREEKNPFNFVASLIFDICG